jgi:hypothetical protein
MLQDEAQNEWQGIGEGKRSRADSNGTVPKKM